MEVISSCVFNLHKSHVFWYLWYLLNSNKGDMYTTRRDDWYGLGRECQSLHHRNRTRDTSPAPGIPVCIGESIGLLTVAQIVPGTSYLNFSLQPCLGPYNCMWGCERVSNRKMLLNMQQPTMNLKSHVWWAPGGSGRAWVNYIMWPHCSFGSGHTVCPFPCFSSKIIISLCKNEGCSHCHVHM